MAEIEKVIKACKYAIGNMIKRGSCSFTSTDEDGYRYVIGWLEVVESLDKIRELQEQIPKWHYVADGDFPKYPCDDVLAYVKGIGFDSSKSSWMVGYFTENNKWFRSHGMQYLVNGEKTAVIAWMELPNFEEVE